MNYNLEFTRHGMERYRERVEPMYYNLDPRFFVYGALTHGYNFYELDPECLRALSYVRFPLQLRNKYLLAHNCF